MKRISLMLIVLIACLSANAQMFRVYKGGEIVYAVSNPDSIVAIPSQDPMETVDLGLPSGTLWATCNIGAQVPEDYGDLYQWGALAPITRTLDCLNDPASYVFYNADCSYSKYNATDGKTILDIEDDVAHVLYGEGWSIPSEEQNEELYKNTLMTEEVINAVPVVRFTATNGKSIIFPKSGYGCYNFGWTNFYFQESAYFLLNFISATETGTYSGYRFVATGGAAPIVVDGKTWYYRYARSRGNDNQIWSPHRAYGCPVRPVYSPQK